MMDTIKNVPDYAYDCAWWVVRHVDGAWWFYGAWDDRGNAMKVAREVNGIVVNHD